MNKKLIFLGGGLLLLAGLAGAAFVTLFAAPEEAAVAEEAPVAEGAPPPQSRKPTFVDLEPFTVPVTRGGKLAYEQLLSVKIEVKNDRAFKTVTEQMPRLRDAFLSDLYNSPAFIDVGRGPIDLAPVSEVLLRSARHVVDHGDELVLAVEVAKWKLPPVPSMQASPEVKKQVKSSGGH